MVDIEKTEYKNYTRIDWAKLWIAMYGQIDGAHHKAWCLDQAQKILYGTKVLVKIASWESGQTEERFYLDDPCPEYEKFIQDYKEDGDWDLDVAP